MKYYDIISEVYEDEELRNSLEEYNSIFHRGDRGGVHLSSTSHDSDTHHFNMYDAKFKEGIFINFTGDDSLVMSIYYFTGGQFCVMKEDENGNEIATISTDEARIESKVVLKITPGNKDVAVCKIKTAIYFIITKITNIWKN